MRDYDPTIKYTAEYLRGMQTAALNDFIEDAKRTQHELRVQSAPFRKVPGPVPPDVWKKIRRDIARALTIINERR
jgi:ribosomal protein L29